MATTTAKKLGKIVILEDEELLLDILTRKFKEKGYQVFSETDGKKGLEMIKSQKPDLILLDLVMPLMDGFEVMRILKDDSSLKHIPIIVISNSGNEKEIQESLKIGAADYIIKTNFNPWEIVEKIGRYFNH